MIFVSLEVWFLVHCHQSSYGGNVAKSKNRKIVFYWVMRRTVYGFMVQKSLFGLGLIKHKHSLLDYCTKKLGGHAKSPTNNRTLLPLAIGICCWRLSWSSDGWCRRHEENRKLQTYFMRILLGRTMMSQKTRKQMIIIRPIMRYQAMRRSKRENEIVPTISFFKFNPEVT